MLKMQFWTNLVNYSDFFFPNKKKKEKKRKLLVETRNVEELKRLVLT